MAHEFFITGEVDRQGKMSERSHHPTGGLLCTG